MAGSFGHGKIQHEIRAKSQVFDSNKTKDFVQGRSHWVTTCMGGRLWHLVTMQHKERKSAEFR